MVEVLAGLPEIAPEIAVFLETGSEAVNVELRGIEIGFEFGRLERRRHGSLGKGANGVGCGERAAMGILVNVDKDAAAGALRDGAFVGDEIGMGGCNYARDDFSESAELLISVNRFDGEIEVHAGGAGSLEEDVEFEFVEFLVESFRDGDNHGEIGAVGRVEVEKEIVGMIDVGGAAAPGIVIDAAEAGEIQKRGAVAGYGVVNFFAVALGVDRNGVEPVGEAVDFTEVFLKEGLPFDAVGIPAENQGTILEEGENVIRHAVVVGKEVAFGVTGLGEVDFVEIGNAEALAIEFKGGIVGSTFEEFGFNLRFA